MAIRTKDQFKALYGSSGTVFPDNTTGDIGDDDVRAQGEDIADSVNFAGGLNWSTVDIGDWDMDANNTVNVLHGLDWSKIRVINFAIRNDANSLGYVAGQSASGANDSNISVVTYDSTNITLTRLTGSFFDSANFDLTGYNRGWVTIGYVD